MSRTHVRGRRLAPRCMPTRLLARGPGLLAAGFALFWIQPLGAQVQPTQPTHPPYYAITNARIVTVSGPTIPNGTIVVRDGVIEDVGADLRIPAGAWTLDATGLTVYPGLIDAFGTLGRPRSGDDADDGDEEEEYSWGPLDRPGTTTWATAADELDSGDDRIEEWREAGFTAALSTRPGGLFSGQAALIALAGEDEEMVIDPAVAQRLNLDSDDYDGYPGSLMGVFAYIEQLYSDARHYDLAWSRYEADPRGATRPAYDRALEPLRDRDPILFPAEGRKNIMRAIRTSELLGVPVVVYGGQRAYEAVDVLAAENVPVLIDLDWPEPPRDPDPLADPTLATLRAWEHNPTTPARLEQAGVPFAFYTGGLSDPEDVREAVERAIEVGLSRDAAIRALTLAPARIFGAADRLGSIEEGKIANFVLTDGDIFDERTTIERVIIDGRQFERFESIADDDEDDDEDEREEEPEEGLIDGDAPAGPVIAMADDDGPYRDDEVTLIRGATIFTVTNGRIEGGDVLIREGRIAAVGTDVDAPGDARIVDATGMYVMPGIIDAHSHIAADAINEGSVAVSAMVGIRDVIDPEDESIYRAVAGGVTSINLLHGSANPIGGKNAVLKLRWGADAEELIFEGAPPGIKFALGENTKRDRDPNRYPNTRMGVQDVIRQAFLDARAYMQEWEAYERRRDENENAIPPRRDLKLETLAEILRGERLVHAHS
ncbi:MAG: amidohydrolase family protein, partial [Longimicrobiales bacterium]